MAAARSAFDRGVTLLLGITLVLVAGCQQSKSAAAARNDPNTTDAEDLRDTQVTQAEELLAGRFAGVQVLRHPNGGIMVRIRGATSVIGSNEPLYVVDGMPLDNTVGGALLGINPADITRIEVLKDIGSTAFYGVRGANGVVLITTRGSRR